MNYDDFLKETEQIKKLSAEEQKTYYGHLLEVSQEKTKVRLHASFCLGQLFYQDGDFRKVIEIMEPIVVDYQSYPYIPKMLSCFNLMGVATHCEAEYGVSRLLYGTALKVAEEHDARFYYAFEYNNIALTYIAEQNYEEALKNLELAEAVLKDCDEEMGAYIYTNKSISLQKLNRLPEAEQAYETGVKQYHADEIVPDDIMRCAATLYYRLGEKEKYEDYKQQILRKMDDMFAAEFMDACGELFACGMDSDDDVLMMDILHSMDEYMKKYPDEIKVGLVFAKLKYLYAVKKADKDAILEALEAQNDYKDKIIAYAEKGRVKSIEQYMKITSQMLDLELDALTGFRNRQAYYKDIAIIKQDKRLRVQPVGVLFADVNGLKRVNDEFGHDAGDELLIHVAKRIATAFPEAKKYRFGGDEFVIFSFDQNETEFQGKLECFVQSWDDEYSASVGSVWLHHAKDCEKGIAIADERMYQDKRRYYKQQN